MPGVRGRIPTGSATLVATCLVLVLMFGGGQSGAADGLPRVTLIGDSVADAFAYSADARRILGQGIELVLEVAPCRRIARDSCPSTRGPAPPVLELVKERGDDLGSTVIVAVGYNEFEDEYARNIEAALDALGSTGVTRVLWPTLRASRHPYLTMNEAINKAAERHPEMTVVEWNVYSRSHPEWFQEDGIHLNEAGVVAMATLFHQALVDQRIPLPPVQIATARLRDAHRGTRYSTRVVARGGRGPYRWSFARVPAGIRAFADGRLSGVPRGRTGSYLVAVSVVDSLGLSAGGRIPLRLRP